MTTLTDPTIDEINSRLKNGAPLEVADTCFSGGVLNIPDGVCLILSNCSGHLDAILGANGYLHLTPCRISIGAIVVDYLESDGSTLDTGSIACLSEANLQDTILETLSYRAKATYLCETTIGTRAFMSDEVYIDDQSRVDSPDFIQGTLGGVSWHYSATSGVLVYGGAPMPLIEWIAGFKSPDCQIVSDWRKSGNYLLGLCKAFQKDYNEEHDDEQ